MASVGGGDEAKFAHLIMELSLRKYRALPKKGKPKRGEEWTPLATILCHQGISYHSGFFLEIFRRGGRLIDMGTL